MTSYDGGKGGAGVSQWIINQIPPHATYIEAFLGAGAVMRVKRPAQCSFGIELDQAVIQTYWGSGIPDLTIICGDALATLRSLLATRQIDRSTFLYCDPPYFMETRSGQRPIYAHEFCTIEQHRALLTLLRTLPCMVAISGYWSALYELELAGWRTSTFNTVKRSGETAEEWLWMNYPAPLELHDYRYLGKGFRERERIKRKKARWVQRLRTMPELERLCLMEAITELRASIAAESHEQASSEDREIRPPRSDADERGARPKVRDANESKASAEGAGESQMIVTIGATRYCCGTCALWRRAVGCTMHASPSTVNCGHTRWHDLCEQWYPSHLSARVRRRWRVTAQRPRARARSQIRDPAQFQARPVTVTG